MRRITVAIFLGALTLCACSTSGSGSSTTTAPAGSLNVTPCNYAQAWSDNPTRFSEFGTLAAFAGKATNATLRDEGHQLASAVASHDSAAVDNVTGDIFATCRQLGLVRTAPSTRQTTG
jgi:hypothetical protein